MMEAQRLWFVPDSEVERLARLLIGQHGRSAARAAAERVNQMIDDGDLDGRDVWARVVQAVHAKLQSSGERHVDDRIFPHVLPSVSAQANCG